MAVVPPVVGPLKVYAGAPTGGNAEILGHAPRAHQAAGGKGTWVLDRGLDRREWFGPPVRNRVAFAVRPRGDRTARAANGRDVPVRAAAAGQACPTPRRRPRGGRSVAVEVWPPEVGPAPLRLAIGWRVPSSGRPVVRLARSAARPAGRSGGSTRGRTTGGGVEDANRGIKPRPGVEGFRVRSRVAIRRLRWLVAWAFGRRNRWGEASFDRLRAILMNHPWRPRKAVTDRLNWIATLLRERLHPHPKLSTHTGCNSSTPPVCRRHDSC